jgi:hypothetical protein
VIESPPYGVATGVYVIENLRSGRCYIGVSHTSVWQRWRDHIRKLESGRHRRTDLQADWDAIGDAGFRFFLAEPVSDPDKMRAREQFWIDKLLADGKSIYNRWPVSGWGKPSWLA